ncbi:MAG: hexitol phosphatase HxpB [Chitinophagia bacterium]|nr:hexitol phosphatase HxpB [Chitinophagia bacterium]
MKLTTVIFDIDGLLINSEPLWNQAAAEVFASRNVYISEAEYATTTGLRTKEFVAWWLTHFQQDPAIFPEVEKEIVANVLDKIATNAATLPGVPYIFDFFASRGFKIGLATSSPPELIEIAKKITGIDNYVMAATSAESLPYGKPHPQVYLNCAAALQVAPVNCVCFEDSFNGMVAAKAARMKCVVVPNASEQDHAKWGAADAKLASLEHFTEEHLLKL